MASLNIGKKKIVEYLKNKYPKGTKALDIGACDGKWWKLLGDHFDMDAIEVFEPNVEKHKLKEKYKTIFIENVTDFVDNHKDIHYDVIIMGDVLEHLTVEDAQKVVTSLYNCCDEFVIAVPYKSKQRAIYGNKYEIHLQPDLTDEIFHQRYPGFERFYFGRVFGFFGMGYAYYIKDRKTAK